MKEISIVIPAYKAEETIKKTIASISIQTIVDKIEIIVSSDDPKGKYGFLLKCFPELDIKILKTRENVGAGLARQKGLDAAKGKWVLFIDADDVLADAFAVERLWYSTKKEENAVCAQGYFEDIQKVGDKYNFIRETNVRHSWLFGRLFNVSFIRDNGIRFSELRAAEDGEFYWKFLYCAIHNDKKIRLIEDVVYYWMPNSDTSITRIGQKNNIGQYDYDFCLVGNTVAMKRYIQFMQNKEASEEELSLTIVEFFIGMYYSYLLCRKHRNEFEEQNKWLCAFFYNKYLKRINVTEERFMDLYKEVPPTVEIDQTAIDEYPIEVWLSDIKSYDFSEDGIDEIRSRLSKDVLENDKRCRFPEKVSVLFK